MKEELLRPYINYQKLNQGTIKDQYLLPLITKILTRLSKMKYISKMNICNTYYLIGVQDEDIRKTATQTQYGLFEFLVMPFRLTNTLRTFQQYVDKALHPYLNLF
jgi:hypothetical protein